MPKNSERNLNRSLTSRLLIFGGSSEMIPVVTPGTREPENWRLAHTPVKFKIGLIQKSIWARREVLGRYWLGQLPFFLSGGQKKRGQPPPSPRSYPFNTLFAYAPLG